MWYQSVQIPPGGFFAAFYIDREKAKKRVTQFYPQPGVSLKQPGVTLDRFWKPTLKLLHSLYMMARVFYHQNSP